MSESESAIHTRHRAAVVRVEVVLVDEKRGGHPPERELPRRSGAADCGGRAGVSEHQVPLQLNGADHRAAAAVHERLGELGAREASRLVRASASRPRHAHRGGGERRTEAPGERAHNDEGGKETARPLPARTYYDYEKKRASHRANMQEKSAEQARLGGAPRKTPIQE